MYAQSECEMIRKKYKVIIVGAGPAGLAAALTFNRLGMDSENLVIERFSFPRYKCCAGYITGKTRKAYSEFGLDTDMVHYSLIKDFNIFYNLKKRQTIQNKFLYTNRKIDRVELDNAFFELAVSAGVRVMENTGIASHNTAEKYIVTSEGHELHYDYLIFADGTSGYGSRYLPEKGRNIAMQMVFASDRPEEIQIHFGITKHGYGWVSSYGGVTNVGLTDRYKPDVNYKKAFKEFMEQLGFDEDLSQLRGAFTPMYAYCPEEMAAKGIFFAGDAAGACDPLTLSGLRYALGCGKACARAIASGDGRPYKLYMKSLRRKFAFMRLLMRIFYLKPVMFCVFSVGCRFFGGLIAAVFNNFFVNKK